MVCRAQKVIQQAEEHRQSCRSDGASLCWRDDHPRILRRESSAPGAADGAARPRHQLESVGPLGPWMTLRFGALLLVKPETLLLWHYRPAA
jgi:hypothetical protein